MNGMPGGRATLIYDGNCGFCRRWVKRVEGWDRHGRLATLPYQAPDLEMRFPAVSRRECAEGMHLVLEDGHTVYRWAAAGREVLRRLPGGLLWTLPFRLPGGLPIAEHIYRWITHRWGPLGQRADGDSKGACDLSR